jgi:hypothetical protein
MCAGNRASRASMTSSSISLGFDPLVRKRRVGFFGVGLSIKMSCTMIQLPQKLHVRFQLLGLHELSYRSEKNIMGTTSS